MSSSTSITAPNLARLLAELASLREAFEQAKQTCVGGDDLVSEAEFELWAARFGWPSEEEMANFPRYQRCMDAYGEFIYRFNHIRNLPLLEPNSTVGELADLFPSLRDAPGLVPFDESLFGDWMKSEATPQAVHAAKLILSVWENQPSFFNLTEAFRDWDDEQARKDWIEQAEKNKKERKRREESDFLQYQDESGLYADFHANRHTFISNLAKSGVSPKVAQTMARHSDINLTMNVYSHVNMEDQAAAIRVLPAPPELLATEVGKGRKKRA